MGSTFLNLESLIKETGLTLLLQAKPKLLLVGTHAHQTTGYSKVTYNIIKELAKINSYELYHFGFQKFKDVPPDYRPYPANVSVYDPAAIEKAGQAQQEMGFGFSQLPNYIRQVKPDIVLIYNDAGIVCRYLDKLTEQLTPQDRTYKLIIYLDQVYQLQRPEFLARMDKDTNAFVTFTTYWKQVLETQGIKKPIGILRHGFDQEQFQVLNKPAMRKKHNVPENVFLILNINRNTPRKRYDIVVTAFAELVARHPTKPLALLAVCDNGETGGFPIQEIYMRELSRLKLQVQFHAHKLMISKESQSYTDTMINELYSLSDIGVSAAEGEGFGLCHFEAMGVGIPQVVPNVGGFKDFCIHNKNSQLIEPKWRNYLPLSHSGVGGVSELVDAHDLSIGMEDYLLDSELRKVHGQAARETVLQYSWAEEVTNLVRFLESL
jgi:glycosyltransferase involved in cell wall biosynthesis